MSILSRRTGFYGRNDCSTAEGRGVGIWGVPDMKPTLWIMGAWFWLWAASGLAYEPAQPTGVEGLRLDTPVRPLEDVPWQRQEPVRLPQVPFDAMTTSAEMVAPAPAVPPVPPAEPAAADPPAPAKADEEYFTLDELKAEMKKLVWTKGDFKIVPYGYLWGSMSYETERTYIGDYVLYVLSAEDEGEDAFHADGKSTRLGIDVTGPQLWLFNGAETGGKVEFDFQGAFVTENKGSVLLRHAYAEIKNESFRFLAGQTWDVISPLYPGTLMYSVGWGGGNIGYRRAQFRLERYYAISDTMLWTVQGSLNHDLITPTDFPTSTAGGVTVRGDHSAWPVIEGRVAVTLGRRGPGCLPITFGASGHIGEQLYDFRGTAPGLLPPADDYPIKTWSVNADVKIPITERLGFQGEFFSGDNLGPYLGGVIQGINPITRRGIRSTGGWGELWYDWTEDLHSHVGYAIDDPLDKDVPARMPGVANDGRTYNQFFFGNLIYDLTEKFIVGVEVTDWKTLYKTQRPGESVHIEFVARYGF